MFQSTKNRLLGGCLFVLAASTAQAGIVLEDGRVPGAVRSPGMRSIILVPSIGPQPETSYLIQRSMAWQTYRRGNPNSGVLLVVPPAVGSVGEPTSIRQLSVRNNLARANAYRLNYFRK